MGKDDKKNKKKKQEKSSTADANLPVTLPLQQTISWQFRARLKSRGTCAIKPWLKEISKTGQADLDNSIKHLCAKQKTLWSRPHASPIGDHIYVIRFKDENRTQHRIYGHFHDADSSFVMTIIGYEKDGIYYPEKHAEKTAKLRVDCDKDHANTTIECRYAADALGQPKAAKPDNYHSECRGCCGLPSVACLTTAM